MVEQNHEAGGLFYAEHFGEGGNKSSQNSILPELRKNFQFTYSFEDVTSSLRTKPVRQQEIIDNLADKTYEQGWLKAHDELEPNFRSELRVDLKKAGVSMEDIRRFNELLFQQISSKKDETLSFDSDCKKNYLLVPLRRVPSSSGDLMYELDVNSIESMARQTNWVSLQDYIDVLRYEGKQISYPSITSQLKDCVFFNRFQPGRCFTLDEVLPSHLAEGAIFASGGEPENRAPQLPHKFNNEKELQDYILKTVFGRKKPLCEGTSLQDWLYLHPNKLASIREIRESIQKLACLTEQEYRGPKILEKIINADLVMAEELKTIDSNCQHRFAHKFAPLPINPTLNSKKKKKDQENPPVEQACFFQRKDNVSLHNAMAVCFHPFLLG